MSERPLSILVTSTVDDSLNSNVSIRNYIAQGFSNLGDKNVKIIEKSYRSAISSFPECHVDLIVAVGGVAIDSSDLYPLRRQADKSGAVLAFWLHDDPYEFDYAFRLKGIADIVFNTDRWSTIHYNDIPAFHLPLAGCDRTHFRPISHNPVRDLMMFFCGYAYDNRIEFFKRCASYLRNQRTYICGDQWPVSLAFAFNERMTPKIFGDTASKSFFTLNIGRDLSIANARLSLAPSTPGPRTFEVALMGSAQMFVADGLEILEYFEKDSEIILINDMADVKHWFERANDDPSSIIDIAVNAQKRALSNHTYACRAQTILDELEKRNFLSTK